MQFSLLHRAALWVVVVGGGNACGVDTRSKLDRASGECLGAVCRRKTCQAAIRGRERQARNDLPISEWGNPAGVMTCHSGNGGGTRGTETSKYPQEKKTDVIAQVAASERATA